MAASQPPAPQTPPKKTSPWLFVLIGCGGLIVIVGLIMLGLGFFAVQKAKQAGIDPDLMQRNPALAAAKMLAAVNPDVEVVEFDEDSGKIRIRDKKSGKTVLVDLEDVKRGRIRFEGDEGETVTIEGSEEGQEGSFRVQSKEGSWQIGSGASADLPAWVPSYPGSAPQGVMSTDTPDSRGGTVTFTTSDPVDKVIQYYAGRLKQTGFEVQTTQQDGAEGASGLVSAQTPDGQRSMHIMIGPGDGATTVGVGFSEKK